MGKLPNGQRGQASPLPPQNQTQEVCEVALQYLENGWAIFPVAAADTRLTGACRVLSGKLATHGRYYITPIHSVNAFSPSAFCNCGVGIATGKISGLIVLDIDGPTGLENAARLQLPSTRAVRTRHGFHMYYAYPDGVQRIPSSPGSLAEGIDVKADSGFVCAPPTPHPEGGRYEWVDAEADIVSLSDDILAELQCLPHRSSWKLYRRFLYRKYLRHPLNALTGM